MKERGIFFSAEMVRAILDGRKTQTRRVVKCPRLQFGGGVGDSQNDPRNWMTGYDGNEPDPELSLAQIACPFGQPGDRLWVRETWYDDLYLARENGNHGDRDSLYYRADGECCDQIAECCCKEVGPVRWRPSIFMPRWASRITLEITGVRVERVQQITPADATAEAAAEIILDLKHPLRAAAYERGRNIRGVRFAGIIQGYAALWDSLNAKRGYGWDTNPWVWVIEFKRIDQQQVAA